MAKKITISVPDELHEKMTKWKDSFNFSQVFQNAITFEIENKERFRFKLKEEKSMQDILVQGNFETDEGQYQTGKEFGFAYAKTLTYHELKPYEEYIEGWKKQDSEIIERIHYDLDIISILDRIGLIEKSGKPKDADLQEGKVYILANSFDRGVVTGVMEFIQEKCSSVEFGKIIIERDKKMALEKGKDKKLKIYEMYKEKIEAALKNNN